MSLYLIDSFVFNNRLIMDLQQSFRKAQVCITQFCSNSYSILVSKLLYNRDNMIIYDDILNPYKTLRH